MLPLLVYLGASALMSLITFVVYWVDKRRASRGGWRVSEQTLHILEFLGGWPGGFIAQRLVRHKNAKLKYQIVFWAIGAFHAASLAGLVYWALAQR